MFEKGLFLSDGWRYLLPLWGVTLVTLIVSDEIFLNLLLLAVSFIAGYIFYIPERVPFETSASALIAPVDGVVSSIEKVDGKTLVKIDKSLFGASAVYSPITGSVKSLNIKHGLFLDRSNPKSDHLNESGTIIYKWGEHLVKLYLKCGVYSLGLLNSLHKDRVTAGEFQLHMSDGTLTIELPENIKIETTVGDKVLGGYSLLAYAKNVIA